MRDLETIHAVLTAAETGHLVLATLHTNDAVSAIDRIIDVFPSHQQSQVRTQLSASLLGVVSQRLLPKRGGGRVAAYEILVATSAIRNLIRENKLHQAAALMEASRREGCLTMDQSLQELLNEGLVTNEEASRYMKGTRPTPAAGAGPYTPR
jgi:twitching motility protein PilT